MTDARDANSPLGSLDHTGWFTPDIERSVAFWTDVMGFRSDPIQERSAPWIGQLMGFPGVRVRIAHLYGYGGHIEFIEMDGLEERDKSRGSRVIEGHVCLRVRDVQALTDRILKNGGTVQGVVTEIPEGIAAGLRGLYLRDPHGVLIELIELPSRKDAESR